MAIIIITNDIVAISLFLFRDDNRPQNKLLKVEPDKSKNANNAA